MPEEKPLCEGYLMSTCYHSSATDAPALHARTEEIISNYSDRGICDEHQGALIREINYALIAQPLWEAHSPTSRHHSDPGITWSLVLKGSYVYRAHITFMFKTGTISARIGSENFFMSAVNLSSLESVFSTMIETILDRYPDDIEALGDEYKHAGSRKSLYARYDSRMASKAATTKTPAEEVSIAEAKRPIIYVFADPRSMLSDRTPYRYVLVKNGAFVVYESYKEKVNREELLLYSRDFKRDDIRDALIVDGIPPEERILRDLEASIAKRTGGPYDADIIRALDERIARYSQGSGHQSKRRILDDYVNDLVRAKVAMERLAGIFKRNWEYISSGD
jgi:hypothetical protein